MSVAIQFTVTQTGHGFTGVVPVYFNSGTNLWTLAQANNANTVATHIAVVTGVNTLNIVYAGTITVVAHGLALGYLFTSDAVAGTFSITSGVIANPMVLVTDANTINVLGYPSSTTAPFQQLPQVASVNTTNYKELTYWDTGYLVRSVKRLSRLSNAQLPPETDLDIMEIMNEALMTEVVPLIISFREEFYVESFTFSSTGSAKIPLRAVGNKVRSITAII